MGPVTRVLRIFVDVVESVVVERVSGVGTEPLHPETSIDCRGTGTNRRNEDYLGCPVSFLLNRLLSKPQK